MSPSLVVKSSDPENSGAAKALGSEGAALPGPFGPGMAKEPTPLLNWLAMVT